MTDWTTKTLGVDRDYLAPDGSGIRLLAKLRQAGLCICELPPGRVSGRIRHKTVDEIWYVVSGVGEITRSRDGREETTSLTPGTSLTIPCGASFQFRSAGSSPLQMLIVTAPDWPGPDEAEVLSPPPSRSGTVVSPAPLSVERRLVQLNKQFGEAERTKNVQWLERVLSDELDFRRANGTAVSKKAFIEGLADREYDTLESLDIRASVLGELAVVTMIVRAAGKVKGEPFGGMYRNIRVFRVAEPDGWELVRWYNDAIKTAAHPPSPDETYERILGRPNTGDDTGLRSHTLQHLYQVIWNRGILSDRDRRLITLAVLAAQGSSDQLKEHLHGARMGGLSPEELLETMIQVAHYGGWATGTAGQKLVLAEFDTPAMKRVDLERRLERGLVQSIFAPCARLLTAFLEDTRPLLRILDVGCGSGIGARVAKERFPGITSAHGLDYSANAIQVANEVAIGREFLFWTDNAETFTVDQHYDAILCQHTIQHLDKPTEAMRRMRDALRPGGALILAAWPDLDACPAYDFLYTAADERDKKAATLSTPLSTLMSYAQGAGLNLEEHRPLATATVPVAPEQFLNDYFESSAGWENRTPPTIVRHRLYELAERLGWSDRNPTFQIGMNVVVARRG